MVTMQTGALLPDPGTAVRLKNSRAWIYIGFQSKRAVLPITLSLKRRFPFTAVLQLPHS